MSHEFERYCKDYENIENYQKAKKDNFKGWECHHRLETHNSDGIRREVDISHKELKALNLYYHRPPEELIFLTVKEHNAFNKGKPKSEETKKKIRASKKGKQLGKDNPFYGKHHSEESKKRMGAINKVKMKGMHWFNNGEKCVRAKECPDGFTPGRLRK